MAIVATQTLSIKEFLRNRALQIPPYQRPYKWAVSNVVQLLQDIERFNGKTPYRIGTIVVHKENDQYKIVDGQQRTVTFLLMIYAIVANKLDELENIDLKNLLLQLKANAFQTSFKSEISKKNIQINYREIERRIGMMDESYIDFFLNKCEVTHFVIDDITEAFQFFDSQNARGKELEPHDLLKAFHLRELHESNAKTTEDEVSKLVDTWECMDSSQLSLLFADFLYRVRGWSKGNSSRYFTKKDTRLFKGINLDKNKRYPYSEVYKLADDRLQDTDRHQEPNFYPFQLDQPIINGKHFFNMVTYYKNMFDTAMKNTGELSEQVREILDTLGNYEGMNRTGDKYVRMLFICIVLYYLDKFGTEGLSKAIEKLFVWSYKPRLEYQNLQLASVDNYVIMELNLFKKIREAIEIEDILNANIPSIITDHPSPKTAAIKRLFQKMKYYAN